MDDGKAFELLPAIDLRGGRVVRLQQGDFARETAFGDDPAAVARRFADGGSAMAPCRRPRRGSDGHPAHAVGDRDRRGGRGTRAAVEVAGGLRDEAAVAAALAPAPPASSSAPPPSRTRHSPVAWSTTHGADRIVVAIDVRDGRAVGHGWAADAAGVDAADAIRRLADVGVTTFEVTAIERDGLLDRARTSRSTSGWSRSVAARSSPRRGIATLDDLRAVRAVGCAGAISAGRSTKDASASGRR